MYLSGTPEQPIAFKVPWVDFGTACLSAFGTMAALLERGKSGQGQKVEGALLRTAIAFANSLLIEQALTGVDRVATRTAASTRRRPIISAPRTAGSSQR